jgi:SAM-dependent methyltransferase
MASINRAKNIVKTHFPFDGYMERAVDSYRNISEIVLKYLQPGSKILDFGSGPCDKTGVLQALGYECSACDDLQDDWHNVSGNREKIIQFTDKMKIDFKLITNNMLPFAKESFDMVMAHDVLEHLHDSPRDLLNDLLERLKAGGLLFITVPNAANIRKRLFLLFGNTNLPRFDSYYWSPGAWRGHVREYVRGDLMKLAEYLNLSVVEIRGCDHMLKKLPRNIRPIYIGLTGLFPGLKDSWLLVAKKPGEWKAKRTLPEDELRVIFRLSSPFYSREES